MTTADWILAAIGAFIFFVMIPATLRQAEDAAFGYAVTKPFRDNGVELP